MRKLPIRPTSRRTPEPKPDDPTERKAVEQLQRDRSEIDVLVAVAKQGYWWPGED